MRVRFFLLILPVAVIGCASGQADREIARYAGIDSPMTLSREGIPKREDESESRPVQLVSGEESELPVFSLVDPSEEIADDTRFDLANSALDVETLVQMALASNPSVQQAEAAVAKANGVRCQVGLKPNPTVSYFGQEIGNDGSAGQHGLQVSQALIRGNKLQWNDVVHSHDVDRARWAVAAQRLRTETDVRVRFYRALTAQRKLERAREYRQEAEAAAKLAKQKLEAEEGTRPDLLQSQILIDQIDLSERKSDLEWQAAWSELSAIIGTASLEPSELSGDFVTADYLDASTLFAELVASSPLMQDAQARINRAQTNLQRQINQVVPNLNAQLGVGYDDSTGDAFTNVQIGLPVPVNNQNQGNIAAAEAEVAASRRNLERLRRRLQRDLASVLLRYEQAAVSVSKYEESIVPRTKESLELIEKAYEAGEIEFLRVLTARQAYFERTQEMLDAKGSLSSVDAEIRGLLLSDSLGTAIEYNGDAGLRGQALSGQ